MLTSSGSSRPDPVLVINDLIAGYGGPPVIRGVSAQVGPGEVVTIVGPNGAGKSTLVKAIAGMIRVTGGSVKLRDAPITKMKTNQLARIGLGYVPQNFDTFPGLTVLENLEVGGYQLRRRDVAARVASVLELMPALKGMLTRRTEKLSGGERKMAGIARALMSAPSILLLDEPTAGLSPELSRIFLEEHIARLASSEVAIMLVEQKALAALKISNWGLLLVDGATHLSCSAPELLARPDIGELFLGRVASNSRELRSPIRK